MKLLLLDYVEVTNNKPFKFQVLFLKNSVDSVPLAKVGWEISAL